MEKIWKIVKRGKRRIKYDGEKRAVLVLGLRGSGKTTTTLLLTKNHRKTKKTSHTVFPNMMKDPENNATYYDCPSFGETRDPSGGITSAYFMKNLIDRLYEVKFLFAIEYSYVRRVDQRQDFIDWIKKIQKIMKNLDKYENSIGLVVTKVDRSDDDIVRGIQNFLETVKIFIQRDEYDWIFKNYAVKLIDIFCKKVTVVNRPNVVKQMMNDCEFVSPWQDFEYDISDRSEKLIIGLIETIHRDVKVALEVMESSIKKRIYEKEDKYRDIYEFQEYLVLGLEQIELILSTKFENLRTRLEESLDVMEVTVIEDDIAIFSLQQEYFQFLRDVGSKTFKIDAKKFDTPLKTLKSYFEQLIVWYRMVVRKYDSLTGYEVQKRKMRDFDWDGIRTQLGATLEGSRNDTLGKKMKKIFGGLSNAIGVQVGIEDSDYEIIDQMQMNGFRWKGFVDMLSSALRRDVSFVNGPGSGEVSVYGGYLSTSDVDLNRPTKIFARRQIFMDSGYGPNVFMIAPSWNYMTLFKDFSFFSRQSLIVGRDFIGEKLNQQWLFREEYKPVQDFCRNWKANFIDLGTGTVQGNYEESLPWWTRDKEIPLISYRECWRRLKRNENKNPVLSPSKENAIFLNDYKTYLLENINDRMTRRETTKFLALLNKDPLVQSLYETHGFIDEFFKLESKFKYELKDDYLPLYESLMERIGFYAEKHFQGNANQQPQRAILWHVYKTAWSKIWSLKNEFSNNLITNVELRLDDLIKEFQTIKTTKKIEMMDNYTAKFNETINGEIGTMLEHIKEQVLPAFDEASKEVTKKVDVLLKEVDTLKADFEKHKKEMEENREKEKEANRWKLFLSILSGIALFLCALTGPVAPVLGAVVGAAAGIGSMFVKDPPEPTESGGIPQAAQEMMGKSREWSKEQKERNKKGITRALRIINIGKSGNKRVTEVKDDLEKESKKSEVDLSGELAKMQRTKKTLKIERVKDDATSLAFRVLSKAWCVGSNLDMSMDEKLIRTEFAEKEDKWSQTIADDEEKIQSMILMRKSIEDNLAPALKKNEEYLNQAGKSISSTSRVDMNLQIWNMKKSIMKMQATMQSMIIGFNCEAEIKEAYNVLNQAMDKLVEVYDQVHDSRDKGELVCVMNNMNNALLGKPSELTGDSIIDGAWTKIEQIYVNNLAFGRYKRLLDGLKLNTFPFVGFYLNPEQTMSNLNPNEDITNEMIRKLKSLKTNFIEYGAAVVVGYDDQLRQAYFSSRKRLENPFYVWKNQDYRHSIRKLLSGNEIVLVADITKGRPENAVKFKSIKLWFRSGNKRIQKELDKALDKFKIVLKHSGVSRYRCGDKVYAIVHEALEVSYSLANIDSKSETPLEQSRANSKISELEAIMSPYATWKLRLVKGGSESNFERLENYVDHIDLELGGSGSYVIENSPVCDTGLHKHYRLDTSLTGSLEFSQRSERQRRETREKQIGINNSYCFNGTVLLADFMARRVTGSKLNLISPRNENTFGGEAFLRSTKMTITLEKLIKDLGKKYRLPKEEFLFDPCVLIDRLKMNFLDDRPKLTSDIMYEFVVPRNSTLKKMEFPDQFLNELRDSILSATI